MKQWTMHKDTIKTILIAQGSACLAGAIAGALEAWFKHFPLLYSLILYGCFTGLTGLVWFGLFRKRIVLFSFLSAGLLLIFSVARFILFRDVFAEDPKLHTLTWLLTIVIASIFVSLVFTLNKLTSIIFISSTPYDHFKSQRWQLLFAGFWPCMLLILVCWPPEATEWQTTSLPPAQLQQSDRPSQGVIWFVADTLRSDSLSSYRQDPNHPALYPPAHTPYLDLFAKSSHLFEMCHAQASWTKPSMASILTSTYVHEHQTMSKHAVLPDHIPTIASQLQQHGICTVAIMNNVNLSPIFGFQQGFEHYLYLPPHRYLHAPIEATGLTLYNLYRLLREKIHFFPTKAEHYYTPGEGINHYVMEALERCAGRDFFVFAHYMEPHDPYFSKDQKVSYARVRLPNPPITMAKEMQQAYNEEVKRLDGVLSDLQSQVLSFQQRQHKPIELHWFFFADHGEEFADHGGFYHGTTLYEEMIHVPLLIQSKLLPPGRNKNLVQLIDIAPTTLDCFGLPIPKHFSGQSLRSGATTEHVVAEEDHQGNQIYTLLMKHPQGSIIKGIAANNGNPRGLPEQVWFNLTFDPTEQSPLRKDDINVQFWHQQQTLHSNKKKKSDNNKENELETIPEATIESLRSLGYIQ